MNLTREERLILAAALIVAELEDATETTARMMLIFRTAHDMDTETVPTRCYDGMIEDVDRTMGTTDGEATK